MNRRSLVRKRHLRIRRKLVGTAERPRLSVFKSNKHVYAQLIDDQAMRTLAAASSLEEDLMTGLSSANCEASSVVGKTIARRALDLGISAVVFDRGGNLYHGRVKALAESAREEGLQF